MSTAFQLMEKVVKRHPVMHHPFVIAFQRGKLTPYQVRCWANQQSFLSVSLASTFAALYMRIPDSLWREKRPLIDLLNVEAWGSKHPNAHSRLFEELCAYLNVDVRMLEGLPPQFYTQTYVTKRLELCLGRTPLTRGLGAIAANEVLNRCLHQTFRRGIHKIEGFADCPTAYFDAHIADESADFEVFHQLIKKTARTKAQLKQVTTGVTQILDLRNTFFTALFEDIESSW